jgi:hypothetical protein
MTQAEADKIRKEIEAIQEGVGYGRVEVVIHGSEIIEVRVTKVLKEKDLTN